jgi:hypothetical protein
MLTEDNTNLMANLRATSQQITPAPAVVASVVQPIISNDSSKATTSAETATERVSKMADIVTGTVTGQLDETANLQGQADIRRESQQSEANIRRDVAFESGAIRATTLASGSDIRRETAKEAADTNDIVKTAAWANSDRTGTEADRVVAQDTAYFIAQQQYAFNNATAVAALKAGTDMQFANTLSAINSAAQNGQAATALEGAKNAAATQLASALLGQQIVADGNATRALVNELKMEQLNRELIERNAALVSERDRCGYWQNQHGNSQFAAVNSALQAFQSQLQETRQGMVNFGSMSGVGQTTTSNQVR